MGFWNAIGKGFEKIGNGIKDGFDAGVDWVEGAAEDVGEWTVGAAEDTVEFVRGPGGDVITDFTTGGLVGVIEGDKARQKEAEAARQFEEFQAEMARQTAATAAEVDQVLGLADQGKSQNDQFFAMFGGAVASSLAPTPVSMAIR